MSVGVILSAPVEKVCCDTGLGSDHTPPTPKAQVVKRVACLICDQVEAAFLMSFAATQACVVSFFTCD